MSKFTKEPIEVSPEALESLRGLEKAGVRFEIPTEGWVNNPYVGVDDLIQYCKNPLEWMADLVGLSVPQYIEWVATDGVVICSATTKRGAPCKNAVSLECGLSASRWLSLRGARCFVHSVTED